MHEIRDWLYIGDYRDTTNTGILRMYGVGAVLQLAAVVQHPPDIEVMVMPISDGPGLTQGQLERGVKFLREQKAAGKTVVSACGAGISRSTTFALAALVEEENLSLLDAFREIHVRHPDALPNPALWRVLLERYDEEMSFVEMWQRIKGIWDENAEESNP